MNYTHENAKANSRAIQKALEEIQFEEKYKMPLKLAKAAPEMLKALEFVKNMLEYEKMINTEEYYLVSKAIKKATS